MKPHLLIMMGFHNQTIRNTPFPHHFVGKCHDKREDDGMGNSYNGFGGTHGNSEEDSGGQNEKKESGEEKHERVHDCFYNLYIYFITKL